MLQIGHVWSTSIPAGSLVKLCRGVYCCTPEYLLLQLSLTLPFSLLVELAYEFCGAYSTSHWGLLPYTRCQPLTSLESLRLYAVKAKGVAGTKGAKGATKLCRALGYAIGGSASPMETVVAMLLSLPKKHGGYGLPRPRLNHWLQVPGTLRSVTGRSEFFCDLYWLDRRFAVEYDGRPYHTGYSNLQKDYARDNGLDDFGIGVKTLMAPDVFDVDRFDGIARQIARRLNVRLREERMGKAWVEKRGQLRRELLDRRLPIPAGPCVGGERVRILSGAKNGRRRYRMRRGCPGVLAQIHVMLAASQPSHATYKSLFVSNGISADSVHTSKTASRPPGARTYSRTALPAHPQATNAPQTCSRNVERSPSKKPTGRSDVGYFANHGAVRTRSSRRKVATLWAIEPQKL